MSSVFDSIGGLFGGGGGGGSAAGSQAPPPLPTLPSLPAAPAAPAPVAPAPLLADQSVTDAVVASMVADRKKFGPSQTILTSPMGDASRVSTAKKQLLGS